MPDLFTEALLCAFSLEYFVIKVNDLFKMPKTVPSIYRSDVKELRDVHMHCFTSRVPAVQNIARFFFNPFTSKSGQSQNLTKFTNIFIFLNAEKQIVPSERTGKEVSFEWQNHRILSKDTGVPVGDGEWYSGFQVTEMIEGFFWV